MIKQQAAEGGRGRCENVMQVKQEQLGLAQEGDDAGATRAAAAAAGIKSGTEDDDDEQRAAEGVCGR